MPLNIDFQQILLHLLNFIILAGGLYLLLYKPVKDFMKKRKDKYIEMDNETKEKLKNATDLENEYQQKIKDADNEISKKKSEAAKEAVAIGEAEIEKAKAQAENIIVSARKEAMSERDRILAEAESQITDIVVAATEKLLNEKDSEAFDKFLESTERGQNNG